MRRRISNRAVRMLGEVGVLDARTGDAMPYSLRHSTFSSIDHTAGDQGSDSPNGVHNIRMIRPALFWQCEARYEAQIDQHRQQPLSQWRYNDLPTITLACALIILIIDDKIVLFRSLC